MDQPSQTSKPNGERTPPSKEAVRNWLAQRRLQGQPPPSIDQVRTQLNWR